MYFSQIRAGLIASALLLTTALASPAFAETLPEISPRQIASDVELKFNPDTGAKEYIAPSFDPFEEDRSMAGTASLRSVSSATTIDGQSVRGGALLDMTFYYNSASNDPYDTRGYEDAVYLSGEYAPVTRRDNRILECNERVQDVVYYHEDYYRPSFHVNLFRPYRHYRGHHRFDRFRDRGYGFGRGFRGSRGFGSRHGIGFSNRGRIRNRDRNRTRTRDRRRNGLTDRLIDRSNREGRRDRNRRGTRDRNRHEDGAATRRNNRAATGRNSSAGEANRAERRANRAERRANRAERNRSERNRTDRNRSNRVRNPRLGSNDAPRARRVERTPRAERTPRPAPRAATPRPAPAPRAVAPAPRPERAAPARRPQRAERSRPARAERAPNRAREIKSRNAPRRNSGGSRGGNRGIKLKLMSVLPMASAWSRNVVRNVDVQCAREEMLTVHIPQERLDAARFDGLTVLVLDRTGQEIPVYVPPNYIEGFRQAVGGQVRPNVSYQEPRTSAPVTREPVYQQPRRNTIESAPCPVGTTKQNDGTCLQGGTTTYGGYPTR